MVVRRGGWVILLSLFTFYFHPSILCDRLRPWQLKRNLPKGAYHLPLKPGMRRRRTLNIPPLYAVHRGRQPGVYLHWDGPDGAHAQVNGFQGAVYRKFTSPKLAQEFVRQGPTQTAKNAKSAPVQPNESSQPASRASSTLTAHEPFPISCRWPCDREKDPFLVYVDGSARLNEQGRWCGGYGVWFADQDPRNLKERFVLPNPTNNRCEILGARRAIELIMDRGEEYGCEPDQLLVIGTDSQYVVNAMRALESERGGWKGGSQRNMGLLKSLYGMCLTRPVAFMWVPRERNRGADQLAKAASAQPPEPPEQEIESVGTKESRAIIDDRANANAIEIVSDDDDDAGPPA